MDSEKQIVYDKRVLVGNWFETSKLQEDKFSEFINQMNRGDLLLAKYRKMSENLMTPTTLTQSPTGIWFGARIALKAPLVPASGNDRSRLGVLLSGFISEIQIDRIQELSDGCSISAAGDAAPVARSTFIITSADNCDRDAAAEPLKYNQDFTLVLASSVDKKPLYVRYDPNPIPELPKIFPVYLSEFPVTNTRWRVLPAQRPDLTRFEQEGKPVMVNKDVVINHSATNVNLAADFETWSRGFYGMECSVKVKNYLNIYKCEKPENIWHIYSAIPKQGV